MSRKTQTFQIGDETYVVEQLGTEIGMPLGHRLLKALGPSVRSFIGQLAALDDKMTVQQFLAQIGGEAGIALKIFEALEAAPTELLVELGHTFAGVTQVKTADAQFAGQRTKMLTQPLAEVYDGHFAGKYAEWVRWVVACIRLNYPLSFLGSTAGSGASRPATGTTE